MIDIKLAAELHCTMTLSANAGVMISWHGSRIWIDALHDQKIGCFSTVTPSEWAAIRQGDSNVVKPDLICFTHCHGDHYSKGLTAQARMFWPEARLAMPEQEFEDQILISGETYDLLVGSLTVRFLHLPHEAKMYANVPHYGVLLRDGTFSILIVGDCEIASPVLKERLLGERVDLALLDFPWLTLPRGRAYVENILRPSHVLVYHLPFREDDTEGYLTAAEKAQGLLCVPDVRLLRERLQRERF